MPKKTTLDEEVEERADYFADWIKKLTDEREEARVVNEKTAVEFIKQALSRDSNLSNLLQGMESTGKGMDSLVKTPYIQSLIKAGSTGEKLDDAVVKLRKKRQSLEQMIPKKKGAVRRKVINKFTTATTLKKYNIKKDVSGRYRDARTGRYVSFDRILKITDVAILNTAKKRRELERFMANIKK